MRSTFTVVPLAGTMPRSALFEQEVARMMPFVEVVQSVGPAKTFPCAESASVPWPLAIDTQSPVRSAFAPSEA